MTCYDFGHRKDTFNGCLPDGKKPIDTGFYYHELMAVGGWYYAPIPGSGRRRFYNRVYFNPSKKEIEDFKLDERATMFINLGKTKYGKLEIKINASDVWQMDDITVGKICDNWRAYYDYIAEKVIKSYIVVLPGTREDYGLLFKSEIDALEFAERGYKGLTSHMKKKYGAQVYKPHTEQPFYTLGGVE